MNVGKEREQERKLCPAPPQAHTSPRPAALFRMIIDRIGWLLLALSSLIVAMFISWSLLSKVDFLYPVWYEVMGLEQTIQTFAPKNRFRDHFEQTDKAEQVRLFTGIIKAIENKGQGLEELYYHHPQGKRLGQLLTEPEIVHLQDVAHLVSWFHLAGWGSIVLFLLLLLILRQRRATPPTARQYLVWGGASLFLFGLMIVAVGPANFFYQLHILVFPEENQWFFYYQDSLMTTMMRAPDLFGYIAAEWILSGLLIQAALLKVAGSIALSRDWSS